MEPFPPPKFICFISSNKSSVFLELPPEKTTILLWLNAHFFNVEILFDSKLRSVLLLSYDFFKSLFSIFSVGGLTFMICAPNCAAM